MLLANNRMGILDFLKQKKDGEQVLDIIVNPSREPYWKLAYQGDCEDIFFITTLDRTNEFVMNMYSLAAESGYPVSNIGVYLQPRHQGANCHCEFNLPYISNEPEEASTAYQLYIRASESLMNQGAFFTRPYGIWADLAFNKDKQSTILLKGIKDIFDPRGVMNPGKLCF